MAPPCSLSQTTATDGEGSGGHVLASNTQIKGCGHGSSSNVSAQLSIRPRIQSPAPQAKNTERQDHNEVGEEETRAQSRRVRHCTPVKRLCHFLYLFSYLETGSCYISQASLKLTIFLLQSSEGWDYSCVPPRLASNSFLLSLLDKCVMVTRVMDNYCTVLFAKCYG
jgi:hypothetical protein